MAPRVPLYGALTTPCGSAVTEIVGGEVESAGAMTKETAADSCIVCVFCTFN